jgi:hypothetical protein
MSIFGYRLAHQVTPPLKVGLRQATFCCLSSVATWSWFHITHIEEVLWPAKRALRVLVCLLLLHNNLTSVCVALEANSKYKLYVHLFSPFRRAPYWALSSCCCFNQSAKYGQRWQCPSQSHCSHGALSTSITLISIFYHHLSQMLKVVNCFGLRPDREQRISWHKTNRVCVSDWREILTPLTMLAGRSVVTERQVCSGAPGLQRQGVVARFSGRAGIAFVLFTDCEQFFISSFLSRASGVLEMLVFQAHTFLCILNFHNSRQRKYFRGTAYILLHQAIHATRGRLPHTLC